MTVGDKLLATTDKGEGRDVPGGGHLDSQVRSKLEAAANRWAATRREAEQQRVSWKTDFTTVSGEEVTPLATAIDVRSDPALDIGVPGEFPYTRGIHPTGYRGKLWTMRQFAGFGSAADTNRRFRYLLDAGQTGLSVAFDLPTLYGYDCDHEMSLGEVGKCGVGGRSHRRD